MAKYHIRSDGNPGRCQAEASCPYGDLASDHYADELSARAAYEKKQTKMERKRERILQQLPQLVARLQLHRGDYSIPVDGKNGVKLAPFATVLNRTMRGVLEETAGKSYLEEEVLVYSRKALQAAKKFTVEDPRFWETYYDAVVEQGLTPSNSELKPLKKNTAYHGAVPVGTIETARTLISFVASYKDSSLIELTYDEEAISKLGEKGFTPISYGAEQVAFRHEPSNTIWKVPVWRESNYSDYIKNALMGQESFPESSTMRHAHTSGYHYDGLGAIAQESVDSPLGRNYSRDEWIKLQLSGHTDLTENAGQDEEGRIVAFDTLGEIWEDIDSYELGD